MLNIEIMGGSMVMERNIYGVFDEFISKLENVNLVIVRVFGI